ncbi:MAG TPA: hypothetical protein VET23_01720 [Chitinophagaceae bacterium]|nr:hypothetical protein [Chitinophagaceae bacterium]
MSNAPYHIVITRKNQVLLSFLKIRVVVNGKEIYPLINDKPVTIDVQENHPSIVVTDGFHHTKPLELVYHHLNIYYFKVICAISDIQLLAGFMILALFYLLGFYTGFFFLKAISFFPIIYILFLYYINRKEFIQITPV